MVYHNSVMTHVRQRISASEPRHTPEPLHAHIHLLEAIGQPLVITDLSGVIVYWNAAAEAAFGWRWEEVCGRSVMDMSDSERWRRKVTRALDSVAREGWWYGETVVQRRDDTKAPVLVQARRWFRSESEATFIVLLVTDLSSQKRIEERLRRRVAVQRQQTIDLQQRLRRQLTDVRLANHMLSKEIAERISVEQKLRFQAMLLDAVSQAVIATNLTSAITYWSRSAERIFGWSEADMIGRHVFDLVAEPKDNAQIAEMRATVAAGHPWEGEFTLTRRDGTMFPAFVTVAAIYDEQQRRSGSIGVISDITDRKRDREALANANARLQAMNADLQLSRDLLYTIVDNLDDALALIDNNGIIQTTNRQFARLFARPPDTLPGASCDTICPEIAPIVARTLASGLKASGRVQLRRASGAMAILDIHSIPLSDANEARRVVLRLVDVTEHLQLEAIMRQNERLAASSRLAAIVAHEINTPLQSIQNYLYLLRAHGAAQSGEFLDLVSDEICRVSGLLRRLLDLHRPGDGAIELIDCNALIERVLLLLGGTLAGSGIRVERSLTTPLPPVSGGRDALTQVLLNLLINAIDAMPCGGTLRIATRHSLETIDQSPVACVQIMVEDTGPGIMPDLQERIFDPFFTTKPHGSGLGLTVSRQIVEQHGGMLRLQSGSGGGATFIVTLPAADRW
ncbi:signal transduction histidine kinase, nitrogen specific, NtrB [Roseiflexus castenholzii DSM 13941]|uniref:histidine kinase n=2 Tax=Roseiflexus castenholzii TaxID=120962 RepID=A7NNS1_ROSCS|nr:signal transduction histidine kinase, nitrogen specific, NtrB [Roseiflexus castenholzii DSM 13941]